MRAGHLAFLLALIVAQACEPELEAGEPRFIDGGATVVDAGAARDARPAPDVGADLDGGAAQDAMDPIVDQGDEDAPVRPPIDAAPDDPDGAPDDPDAAPPRAVGPTRYPLGRLLSPMTETVADTLRRIAATAPDRRHDVFAKIGDSLTVSNAFLKCFSGDDVELAGRGHLQDTIDHFRGGRAGGTDPFRRDSEAAEVGWSAIHVLRGDPSPFDVELMALNPRFAVVMYGTNDIQRDDLLAYADEMRTIVDRLIGRGIIPVLSSIPPRGDSAEADALVPTYNAVVRGLAEGRQVPFVDLEVALRALPRFGLAGDRLHTSTYQQDGRFLPCAFTEAGLRAGYNWRNLLTIQALDAAVAVVIDDAPAPDAAPAPLRGVGTPEDPIEIDGLPFSHFADSREAPSQAFDRYPGCNAPQDEGGGEHIYRIEIDRPTTLRAYVFDQGEVDIDIHLLGGPDPETCLDRDHHGFAASLDPGTWYFSLDTFAGPGGPAAGEYLFVLVADDAE